MAAKRLVILEHGEEVGYVTGSGETSYDGEYDFVQTKVDRVDGGYRVIVPAEEQSDDTPGVDEGVKESSPDEMFEYIVGNLSGIDFLSFRVEENGEQDTE